jgi:putative transposase
VACINGDSTAANTAERRAYRSECIAQSDLFCFGEDSLRIAVREFVTHYHRERNHQGIVMFSFSLRLVSLIAPHPVRCRSRLGGMLNYYDRAA